LIGGMVLLLVGAGILAVCQMYAYPTLWGFIGPMWVIALGISITCAVTANGALRAFNHAAGTATAIYRCGESIVVAIAGTLALDWLAADTAWPLVGFCTVFGVTTITLASTLRDA
jgi:MFS transporter, DHA1 family, chloramphenicol/florfenicol resistance protein